MMEARAAIAMRGAVDSSAAAAILKEAGCDLVGFSMQLWDQRRNPAGDFQAGRCCSIEDLYDAREVAARLGIPYYVVDFQKEFEQMVVKDFVESYKNGLTPSPCVLCNSHMKFDQLMRMAEEIQAPRVATGHYARIRNTKEGPVLAAAADASKDQTYFLWGLSRRQLPKILFPVGGLLKKGASSCSSPPTPLTLASSRSAKRTRPGSMIAQSA